MTDGVSSEAGTTRATDTATTGVFVSIYLLLLAFFVVMNSISNQEMTRSDAVMESVHSTFRNQFSPEAMTPQEAATPMIVAPSDAFEGELRGVLDSVLGLKTLYPALGGRLLQVEVPVEDLFAQGDVSVRPDRRELFRQLALLIAGGRLGERRSVEFLVAVNADAYLDGELSWQSVPLRRAGALARALIAEGVPETSVSVGLRPVPADRGSRLNIIQANFVTRPLDQDQLRFAATPEADAQ